MSKFTKILDLEAKVEKQEEEVLRLGRLVNSVAGVRRVKVGYNPVTGNWTVKPERFTSGYSFNTRFAYAWRPKLDDNAEPVVHYFSERPEAVRCAERLVGYAAAAEAFERVDQNGWIDG